MKPATHTLISVFMTSVALVLAACAPSSRVVTFEVTEQGLKIQQAGALVQKGYYRAFQKAVGIYGELYARPSLRPKVAVSYLEACLLLALREKEIGIDDPATLDAAGMILKENPMLAGFEPHLTLISALPLRTRGVMRDIDTSYRGKMGPESLKVAEETVRKSAATSVFSASVAAAWTCSYGVYSELWRDPAGYLTSFPESLPLMYEIAICSQGKPELLRKILEREPEFSEANYHLGEISLREGRLLEAEAYILKAYQAIPESPQARILLAGIYFATEEFDRSLEFYDLTLQISPAYRDALLGKAICLSYLGKYEEALPVLERILELGYWLIGEAHYWLAWNLHELKREPEALRHIDEAKGRLPTNSEVFGLAGTLSLDLGELDRAEKDFLESLKYNEADTESLFGLGTVTGRRDRWGESGAYYERAGRAWESMEAALKTKIEDVRSSALSEDRKGRLLRRRQAQLERARLAEATAYYNAAASYLNGGLKDKAAETAAKAAAHPALKHKAEELLKTIKL